MDLLWKSSSVKMGRKRRGRLGGWSGGGLRRVGWLLWEVVVEDAGGKWNGVGVGVGSSPSIQAPCIRVITRTNTKSPF